MYLQLLLFVALLFMSYLLYLLLPLHTHHPLYSVANALLYNAYFHLPSISHTMSFHLMAFHLGMYIHLYMPLLYTIIQMSILLHLVLLALLLSFYTLVLLLLALFSVRLH